MVSGFHHVTLDGIASVERQRAAEKGRIARAIHQAPLQEIEKAKQVLAARKGQWEQGMKIEWAIILETRSAEKIAQIVACPQGWREEALSDANPFANL